MNKHRSGVLLAVLSVLALIWTGCSRSPSPSDQEVVVYTSEDQVFSEPILRDFEKETGIKVKALFDTEETKGTGTQGRRR